MSANPQDRPQELPSSDNPSVVFHQLGIYFNGRARGGYLDDLILEQWREREPHRVRLASHQVPQLVEALLRGLGDVNKAAYAEAVQGLHSHIQTRRQHSERREG
jgi:hypothetical protein